MIGLKGLSIICGFLICSMMDVLFIVFLVVFVIGDVVFGDVDEVIFLLDICYDDGFEGYGIFVGNNNEVCEFFE